MKTAADQITLAQAREELRARVTDGAVCPCCTQYAKVYRRKITSQVARVLIAMHRDAGTGWVHLPTLIERKGADEAKARYWGLIEASEDDVREDGSPRVGWWRLTPAGEAFVLDRLRVPKYAHIYDGRCLSLDDTETVSIRDALGTRFDYRDLMAGT